MSFIISRVSLSVFKKQIYLVVSLFLLLCNYSHLLAEDKLQLNTGTLSPYTTADQQGFLDLMIKDLFQRIGVDAEVVVYSASARALANANSAKDAGVAMRIKGLEKRFPNLIRVPEKLIDNDFVAYSKDLDVVTDNWQSLKPYRVGYILGWQVFEKNLDKSQTKEKVINPMQLFTQLQSDKVDLVLYERWQGLQLAKNLGIDIKQHQPVLHKNEMYIYMHKKYAHMVTPLSEALVQMKKDGSYQRIIDKTLSPLFVTNKIVLSVIQEMPLNTIGKTILDGAYARLGYKVEYKEYPGKRALIESNSGRNDGELFRKEGMEQFFPNLIRIPVAINEFNGTVVTKNSKIEVAGWNSLKPYKIGVLRGLKFAETGSEGMQRIFGENKRELVELLDKGVIDLFVLDKYSSIAIVKKNKQKGFVMLNPPVESIELFHYVHKSNQELVEKLTTVLLEMKNSGTIDRAVTDFFKNLEQPQ